MYSLSRSSKSKLDTCDPRIVVVVYGVLKIMDIKVLCGVRGPQEQNKAYKEGKSHATWPNSAHNVLKPGDLSLAIDLAPYQADKPGGIDRRTDKALWEAVSRGDMEEAKEILENIKRWKAMVGAVLGVAAAKGVKMINGSDWDKDFRFNDHNFIDSPHFQIVD
jgi:peptidoglycan L-alanyl-D-glutamate endopeptidase CwlK